MGAPLQGMTGFGRADGQSGDVSWVWEVRSVNGRNLDIKYRTPPGFDGLEAKIRDACSRRFKRGSLQVSLATKRAQQDWQANVVINHALVGFYLDAGAELIDAGRVAPPRWDGILGLRGVIEVGEHSEDEATKAQRDSDILAGLDEALDQTLAARQREGAALHALFSDLFDRIAHQAGCAQEAGEAQVLAIRDRVQKRAAELLGETPFDPQRLVQEAAALALKADVREELDRLTSHIEEARKLLANGGEIGRKLEFLAQEFHRESNTLTAKAATMSLTRAGLELKAAVDQLKEQAANVE